MKYAKPPLTVEQQADLLIARGMLGDRALLIERLKAVSYYRLSGYSHTFRIDGCPNDSFQPGTSFESVWGRYAFDRKLRLLVMDGIERIEVAVRTLLAFHHSHASGPFAYAQDSASLPNLSPVKLTEFTQKIHSDMCRSGEKFVKHFRVNYGDCHTYLPIWMAVEIMNFGDIVTLYRGASENIRKLVAYPFRVPDKVFDSWLLTLNAVRNICAHHGRLWNRELGIKPKIPRDGVYPDWHRPVRVLPERVFSVLTICRHCLRQVAPQSKWPNRLLHLLDENTSIPTRSMGFPEDWRKCPIWH